MSLRVIHIFFILASVALCFFFGYWLMTTSQNPLSKPLGVCVWGVAVGLLLYLSRFIAKTKHFPKG